MHQLHSLALREIHQGPFLSYLWAPIRKGATRFLLYLIHAFKRNDEYERGPLLSTDGESPTVDIMPGARF